MHTTAATMTSVARVSLGSGHGAPQQCEPLAVGFGPAARRPALSGCERRLRLRLLEELLLLHRTVGRWHRSFGEEAALVRVGVGVWVRG